MTNNSLNKVVRAAKLYESQIVTHRLNMFLMQNPNLVLDDWVADLIREQLVKQPRDRAKSFSSSAAGNCLRKQIFDYIAVDTDGVNEPQLQNVFYDGTWRHLRWQATLLQAGILTHIEFPLHWEAKQSKGTMDGLGVVPSDHPNQSWRGLEFGFELKGMNTYGFKGSQSSNAINEKHLDQIHRYFLSGGFELFVVIYEDKNTQEWIEWVVEPDQERLERQRQELDALNDFVSKKELPQALSACVQGTGNDWRYCPYSGKTGICMNRSSW